MEFVETTITSKNQITIPKEVRETLELHENDRIIFLVENKNVRIIKKPKDILDAMSRLSEGVKVSAKNIREDIKKDRQGW